MSSQNRNKKFFMLRQIGLVDLPTRNTNKKTVPTYYDLADVNYVNNSEKKTLIYMFKDF